MRAMEDVCTVGWCAGSVNCRGSLTRNDEGGEFGLIGIFVDGGFRGAECVRGIVGFPEEEIEEHKFNVVPDGGRIESFERLNTSFKICSRRAVELDVLHVSL